MMKLSLILFAGCLLLTNAAHWGYPDFEENRDHKIEWGGLCEKGKRQSPIGLNTNAAFKGRFSKFKLQNYDDILDEAKIINTGHSVQINVPHHEKMTISGGGFKNPYILEQMHWHWWSEHMIDGRKYPLELHLVHRNTLYHNISEAVKHKEGLAVLGVMFHVTEEANVDLERLAPAIDLLKEKVGIPVVLPNGVKPIEFLPDELDDYFRYEGSLTTPTCDESVVWTVFTDTLPVTLEQVNQFKEVKDEHGRKLVANYRPVQYSYNRAITYITDDDDDDRNGKDSATTPMLSTSILAILALMSLVYT